jgi:PAS domain S-box-containing protein
VRRGERLLASVVQTVDDGMFTADARGRLVTLNPAGRRLLGRDEAEVPRLGYRDLLGGEDAGPVADAIEREVAAGAGWTGQIAGRGPDGTTFPAHLALRCVFDGGGHLVGAVGVLRDLTEQVETERRLIQREKLASLGEMAAGVAHEIRNPLGGIKMATRLLAAPDTHGSPLSEEMARSILSGIAEIEGIINSLLDYTREMPLERGEYDLLRVLDPVLEAAAAEARPRGIVVVYGAVDREAVVLADGQKLRQVFANVIKNAVEAIDPRHGGRVEVNLVLGAGRAVVEVADSGGGIPPEHRDKIFLPFFTTKPSGTGLGMSIVKRIVDLHGGDIAIESAPGAGTRVRIALPVVAPAVAQEVRT